MVPVLHLPALYQDWGTGSTNMLYSYRTGTRYCQHLWHFPNVGDPDSHGRALIWLSRIRIRMGIADPDPGGWKLTRTNRETWFPAFQKCFCTFASMFWPFTYFKYIFYANFHLFVTLKSDHWPGSGCALVWLLRSGSALRLKLDPDPHWNQCGSTTVHNIAFFNFFFTPGFAILFWFTDSAPESCSGSSQF